MTLYRFDKKLRILLFNEIEKIEIAIRSVLANIGCQELNDKYWITEAAYFANSDKFNQTLSIIDKELISSKEDYIEEFRQNFIETYPPAWMITEVLSFGNLNYIYSNISKNQLMKHIAGYFGLKPQVFTSWLTVLANLRNMCCHHARVWNKENPITPMITKKPSRPWVSSSVSPNRTFFDICIIKWFIDIVSPHNDMKEHLQHLLTDFPMIDIKAMGFPTNWQEEPLWKE